jgi:hypothetical protein
MIRFSILEPQEPAVPCRADFFAVMLSTGTSLRNAPRATYRPGDSHMAVTNSSRSKAVATYCAQQYSTPEALLRCG